MSNLSRTHDKALTAIAWRMQDEHGLTFNGALRAIDGDPVDVLREMRANALPITREQLRAWIEDTLKERRSA